MPRTYFCLLKQLMDNLRFGGGVMTELLGWRLPAWHTSHLSLSQWPGQQSLQVLLKDWMHRPSDHRVRNCSSPTHEGCWEYWGPCIKQ